MYNPDQSAIFLSELLHRHNLERSKQCKIHPSHEPYKGASCWYLDIVHRAPCELELSSQPSEVSPNQAKPHVWFKESGLQQGQAPASLFTQRFSAWKMESQTLVDPQSAEGRKWEKV